MAAIRRVISEIVGLQRAIFRHSGEVLSMLDGLTHKTLMTM
jgi:hypothetical protein